MNTTFKFMKNNCSQFLFISIVISLLIVAGLVITLLLSGIHIYIFKEWIITMFSVFSVALPTALLVMLFFILFSHMERANTENDRLMSNKEMQTYKKLKGLRYGILNSMPNLHEKSENNSKGQQIYITEENILSQYITKFAPFLQQNVKINSSEGPKFFDAYANVNGCNYVVEVKQLECWTKASKRGVEMFATNAKNCFSSLHMTIILSIRDAESREKIAQDIHSSEPALNIIFASSGKELNSIVFSNIY